MDIALVIGVVFDLYFCNRTVFPTCLLVCDSFSSAKVLIKFLNPIWTFREDPAWVT